MFQSFLNQAFSSNLFSFLGFVNDLSSNHLSSNHLLSKNQVSQSGPISIISTPTVPHSNQWKQWVNAIDPEILQLGDSGTAVKTLQLTLHAFSLYEGTIDGSFGPQTEAAIATLQASLGTETNGIFDQMTWYALSFWTP